MNNNPYTFQDNMLTDYFNLQPSKVKGKNNRGTEYYKRILYNKLYSVYQFTLPKDWKMNFFRFFLFHYGSIAVIYTKEYGWTCQPYGITELDLYYNPKKIIVSNRFFKEQKIGIVGENCEVINILDDFYGLDDLITRYAVQLADIEKSININLMNSNVSYMFPAENKKEADTIREAYGKATTGEPLVVINKEVMEGKQLNPFLNNVSSNYIVDKLVSARRSVLNAFLTEIGIRNANIEKRERMNSQEVGENDDETRAICSVIYDNLTECFDRINAISNLGLSVSLRYDLGEDVGGFDLWQE